MNYLYKQNIYNSDIGENILIFENYFKFTKV
jgi:hypothetical protein